jgi:hypothetical protein
MGESAGRPAVIAASQVVDLPFGGWHEQLLVLVEV